MKTINKLNNRNLKLNIACNSSIAVAGYVRGIIMEIEIITTKKKLTASMVNQMFDATFENIMNSECLGFVTAFSQLKEKHPTLILKLKEGGYRTTSTGWHINGADENAITRQLPKYFSATKKLSSSEEATSFVSRVDSFYKTAKQIYI